ncbi:constitutive coactivator of PPAR-gamma-like protein 1 isoform X1 [Homalodisca vitripennis]|uniref:Constitutive coactivator of PPAR-gamma-like protein 1 homolog n=1 Tax=Homalodisca liturata TaxID=320908 RepID=A0A1B6IUQ0_9HEMI|nr:constitutive coactivator of PPAR-gamma-like protein 1 isoform X1 [Homalodisca vitripennis]KAG8242101.1 hypothetical protein J6590_072643 [Homalodisca vitripennis]
MGIQDLQTFLESGAIPESCVGVDLVRIAKTVSQRLVKQAQKKGGSPLTKFSLVVDGECCLDRLYGGYFSDWACGGQWNRMVSFLAQFVSSLQKANIDLVVFFNGCTEPQRMAEWIVSQQRTRQRVNQVLKHVSTKGTPPPKVWWTSPVCLRTAIRMVLRHLNVAVVCTMDDHKQEVIAYCRENNFHGLIADDAEYVAFDPPRYFSARQLKLTYKGSLESKEYILPELVKGLGLSSDKVCVLAALLGNYILPEHELADVYKKAGISQMPGKIPGDVLIKQLAEKIKDLQNVDNIEDTATAILGSPTDLRLSKLKQSIQYYLDGTKDGFLRYRPSTTVKKGRGNKSKNDIMEKAGAIEESLQEPDLDTSKLASETAESELDSLTKYKEATACLTAGPEIIIDEPALKETQELDSGETDIPPLNSMNGSSANGRQNLLLSSSSSSSSSSATSPARLTPEVKKVKQKSSKSDSEGKKDKVSITLPTVPPEVMRTVSERHNKGLMSPCIYQILTQGEIKLPVVMEDESHKEIPSIHHFYRPVRQMVYAILFNLHHHNYMATRSKDSKADAKPPDVRIREWIWTKSNQYQRADIVPAEQIGWGVPTIQRLWFGTTIDDKRRRLRAFLTCMRSDTALMLNPDYVPQHLLIMATVLRYMMSFPEKKVLRKPELDAFITTAIMPELMNAELNQDLQLQVVSSRGVQLATMFMQGVETALLVNDACGAPVPWLMCCPWLFFDGKLFHHQLSRAAVVKNIMELCNHRIRMVMKVERMRQAVLEGLNVQFARPPIPGIVQGAGPRVHPNMGPPNMMPPGLISNAHPGAGRGLALRGGLSQRGLPRRPLSTNQGGRLEIAGVVVGSWGPNYGLAPIGVGRSVMVQPQVTSVGGLGGYGDPMYRGSNRPTFNPRNPIKGKGRGFRPLTKKRMMPPTGGKREPTKKTTKGRGMSVVLPATGETVFATDVIDDKQKKILMNKDVSEKKMGLLSGTEQLMNGGAGDASSVQFEDATDHVDIPGMNGEGDGPMGVKQILAAAKVDN